MKLGCHAVLYKERIKSETEAILKGIADTGFAGFEMGARFFGIDEKQKLTELLGQYGLQLSGMHMGFPLQNWIDKEEECAQKLLAAAEFVKDMPNKNIILSGSPIEEGADVIQMAKSIERAAKRCREVSVTLNYHNHAWEFINDARMFYALVEHAPTLFFGLDLGWIYKAGFDPVEIVKTHGKRISYVHLRDAKHREGREFTEMGEGTFDYPLLLKTLEEILGDEGWAIVEYEEGEQDFQRYKKAKDFLDGIKNC